MHCGEIPFGAGTESKAGICVAEICAHFEVSVLALTALEPWDPETPRLVRPALAMPLGFFSGHLPSGTWSSRVRAPGESCAPRGIRALHLGAPGFGAR